MNVRYTVYLIKRKITSVFELKYNYTQLRLMKKVVMISIYLFLVYRFYRNIMENKMMIDH